MDTSAESKKQIKGIINILLVILGIGFLAMLIIFKGSMNNLVSMKMAEQTGATGCISCRKMELVMKEVKEKYPETVNVRFYNVLLPENQEFMKFFGIAAIPTQVLLDPAGKEIFRHTGYFPFDELEQEFKKSNLL